MAPVRSYTNWNRELRMKKNKLSLIVKFINVKVQTETWIQKVMKRKELNTVMNRSLKKQREKRIIPRRD